MDDKHRKFLQLVHELGPVEVGKLLRHQLCDFNTHMLAVVLMLPHDGTCPDHYHSEEEFDDFEATLQ